MLIDYVAAEIFSCSASFLVNIPSPIVVLFNLELPIANSLLSKAAFLEITWRTVRTSNLRALKSSFAVPLQSANRSLIGLGIAFFLCQDLRD